MSDIQSRIVSGKKVNFREVGGVEMGTTLYQHSIEHHVICDHILKAFQCIIRPNGTGAREICTIFFCFAYLRFHLRLNTQ